MINKISSQVTIIRKESERMCKMRNCGVTQRMDFVLASGGLYSILPDSEKGENCTEKM